MTTAFVVWMAASILFHYSARAQAESNVTPVHCLILAAMGPVMLLPVNRMMRWRLFRLYWAIWCGITIPGILLLFTRTAGFSSRCDHLFYGSGIFAMVVITLDPLEALRKWRRSRSNRTTTSLSAQTTNP